MISKSTFDAVKNGILTDDQLEEAIPHFEILESFLKCHGDLYHLVWRDVFYTLFRLKEIKSQRDTEKKRVVNDHKSLPLSEYFDLWNSKIK